MNLWENILNNTIQTRNLTEEHSIQENQLIEDGLSLYANGLQLIPSFKDDDALLVRVALLSHNLNTLIVAFDASSRGFYLQAISLLKNVYENWLAFWYLLKYPYDAKKWLDPRWDRRPHKAETMRNKIDHPSKDTKSKLYDFYDEINRFAHTEPISVLSIINPKTGKIAIGIGVQYDQGKFAGFCYFMSLWIGQMLDALSTLIPKANPWHDNYTEMMTRLLSYINHYNEIHDSLENVNSD